MKSITPKIGSLNYQCNSNSRLLPGTATNASDPVFFPDKGTAPKKRIPTNVNNYDNNVLDLSNRKKAVVTFEGGPLMYSYDSTQQSLASKKHLPEKPVRIHCISNIIHSYWINRTEKLKCKLSHH